ncbi:Hypothetical predicted protein [Pelobates cultripes]|uniref:Uncharacterized protein n=1 Tax=Pelobates cultripes TaxID=61616 RepID=A0AAD1R2A1_PELCU|nr:Hypothetical predicted protein [Pelobates cultripes]
MGHKNKKPYRLETTRKPDIQLSFERPALQQKSKMAPEAHYDTEMSEASQDDREALPSPKLDKASL